MVDGQTCEKWVLRTKIGEKENKYNLWIRYEVCRYLRKSVKNTLSSFLKDYSINFCFGTKFAEINFQTFLQKNRSGDV